MPRKTINRKIQLPIILLMVAVPLATLLIFNLAMRIYSNNKARTELDNMILATESVAKNALSGASDGDTAGLAGAMAKLRAAIRVSEYSVDTQILLFNRQDKLVYPTSLADSGVSDRLYEKIVQRLDSLKDKKVYTLRADGRRYLVNGYQEIRTNAQRSFRLVFIVSTSGMDSILRVTNIILISVMLAGIAVGASLARRVAKKIATPVAGLCRMADQIGQGSPLSQPVQTDIAELSALSASFLEMAARLEAYDRSRKTFLQNASHELRTPLMSIQGYAEGIASGVLPDTAQAAKIIGEESKRLNTLVEELLTLSRIENQTYGRQMQVYSGGDLLRDSLQRLGGYASKVHKELSLMLPSKEIRLLADENLLAQVITNLVSNGLRYAKAQVVLSLEEDLSDAVLRVSDDGGGIDPADLPHLFERFYKGKGGNFGLGLSIAESGVKWMGGTIRAYNNKEGAVFEIRLKKAE